MTAVPLVAFMVTAALALALLPGHGPTAARLAGSRGGSGSRALGAGTSASPFGTYPGEQGRGVFQTISRIAAWGSTIFTTGAQVSDGVVRQQFFASADGGASWRLAPVRLPGGGQPPLGYAATRLAGGPKGWVAIGRPRRRPSGPARTACPGRWRPGTGSPRSGPATRSGC